jgi:hypothetical protein
MRMQPGLLFFAINIPGTSSPACFGKVALVVKELAPLLGEI